MCNRVQAEIEVWRVIIFRRNASELLVFESEAGLYLPRVEVSAHSRVAQALNAQIEALWNLEVYSLYPLPVITLAQFSSVSRYHVIEALAHEAAAPRTAHWLPTRGLTEARFIEFDDFAAVQMWIENLTHRNSSRSPFEKPGWFLILKDLVQDAIRTFPLTLSGGFLQLNASSTFSLIRFETDGDAVWFKAVGEPNEREFPLTVLLSSMLPSYTPRVLATQPLWNAWMTLEVPGLRLSQTNDFSAWSNAARDLARMQIASIEMAENILGCQARDIRVDALLGQVEPFFARLHELMERQPKSTPPRLSPSELAQLEVDTRETLLALQHERIPDSLGHLDLNPENIIALPDRTVFLDWAEGSVGHPFFSFAYLLEHFQRIFGGNAEGESRLIREYVGVWESTLSVGNTDKTLSVFTFLAIFVHAVSTDVWRDDHKLLEPGMAGYYRSLARRMKLYGDRIRAGVSRVSELLT